MIRSLFVKELKERKLILILGVLLCLASPLVAGVAGLFTKTNPQNIMLLRESLSWFFYALFAMLYPVILGAGIIAGEVQSGTMPFLLSLPRKRWQIWATKVTALMISLYSLLILFVALNPTVVNRNLLDFGNHGYGFPLMNLLLLLIPGLCLASTIFSSTLFSREMAATGGGVLLIALQWGLLILISRILLWDMLPLEILVFLGGLALVMLLASLRVFIRGEQLNHGWPKFRQTLIPLMAGLVIWLTIMGSFYGKYANPTVADIHGIGTVKILPDGSLLAVASFTHHLGWFSDYHLRKDDRFVIIKPDKKPEILPIKLYSCHRNMGVSDDGRYIIVNHSSFEFTGPLQLQKAEDRKPNWLVSLFDLETLKCIQSWDARNHKAFLLDENSFILIKTDIFNRCVILEILDFNGNRLSHGVLPLQDHIQYMLPSLQGKNLYLQEVKKVRRDGKLDSSPVSIYRVIPGQKLEFEPAVTLTPQDEGEKIHAFGLSLSPNEDRVLYYSTIDDKDTKVYIYNLDGNERVELKIPPDIEGFYPFNSMWLDNSQRIILWKYNQPGVLYDSASGEAVREYPSGSYGFSSFNVPNSDYLLFLRQEPETEADNADKALFIDYVDVETGDVQKSIRAFPPEETIGRFNIRRLPSEERLFAETPNRIYVIDPDGARTLYLDLEKYRRTPVKP